MPSETFQYDIVFDTFRKDTEFWANWKVKGCARNSPEESISQESASIRVVMDLPSTQKLYPTAYTPGFPTLPCNAPVAARSENAEVRHRVDELPPGYSVALDVHILEDARIMLDFQRSFRGGSIDPKYKWLDAIVAKVDGREDGGEDTLALTDGSNPQSLDLNRNKAPEVVRAEAEAKLRPPVGSMSLALSSGTGGASKKKSVLDQLESYSDRYGDGDVIGQQGAGPRQVYEENTLVNAFGSGLRLPAREGGSWDKAPEPSSEDLRQQMELGLALDSQLSSLLERTREPSERPAAGGTQGDGY